ncbi:MAG TPA: VanW family protein [Candidatus Portnoybacteria bacterium]|jgi:vancomycin resistance protein YoaR|nr:VanW family protein [Candidatus Portnoybacteria bacterium]MDD5752260.1 VanW family protein [Candidatus Portnoybacteria bacterium]HPH52300.1 VanW family protein [Candidatus Portnoybacteria bacterium]HPJ80411.1 VanW family protein [Candidatus Portnoybacteria bacterium]
MKKISPKILLPITIILLITIFVVILNILNSDKINFGTKIAGISVGGLSKQQALNKLNSEIIQFSNKDFNLIYKNYLWTVNLKNLGAEINAPKTINNIYRYGHQSRNIINNVFWQIKSFLGYNFSPSYDIDEEKLEIFLKENLSSIHQPAKNSLLVYDKKTENFIITPSNPGIIINKKDLKQKIEKILKNLKIQNIELFLIEDYPTIIESQAKKLIPKAKDLLAKTPISIIINDKEIEKIDQDAMLNLMDPIPDLNDEKIKNHLTILAPLIAQEPIDAQLTVVNNKVTNFALSQNGLRLEIENNIDTLKNGILNNQKKITLKTIATKPKISTENIDNLGITAFLAKGVSNFSGSSVDRITNIKIGAARFNGVLLKPNEEFSFNNLLGEVGPEQGYKPGLVIKENKTTPEYGGGLCQVSTTAFRAAIYSGMEITQRYPHAFPVKYYNPQGFDATIYPPSPDLKFINNTSGHILIQTKIIGKELVFEFYGTNDGRKVEIIGPEQYDINLDSSMKAKLTQKVYDKNGNIIIDKTFYSNYKSPNLFPEEIVNPLQ